MRTLSLRGRVAAVHAADDAREPTFSLLLCTQVPGKDGRGARDTSATALLRCIPPMHTWDSPRDPAAADAADELPRAYKFPYQLLADEALTAAVMANRHGGEEQMVCSAEITYPRPRKGKRRPADADEWGEHWRGKVRSLAGQWVEVTVDLARYSFEGTARGAAQVRRVGTRLVLQDIAPVN